MARGYNTSHGMKVMLTVSITLEQANALRMAADQQNVTVQVFVRKALDNLTDKLLTKQALPSAPSST